MLVHPCTAIGTCQSSLPSRSIIKTVSWWHHRLLPVTHSSPCLLITKNSHNLVVIVVCLPFNDQAHRTQHYHQVRICQYNLTGAEVWAGCTRSLAEDPALPLKLGTVSLLSLFKSSNPLFSGNINSDQYLKVGSLLLEELVSRLLQVLPANNCTLAQ